MEPVLRGHPFIQWPLVQYRGVSTQYSFNCTTEVHTYRTSWYLLTVTRWHLYIIYSNISEAENKQTTT